MAIYKLIKEKKTKYTDQTTKNLKTLRYNATKDNGMRENATPTLLPIESDNTLTGCFSKRGEKEEEARTRT